MPENVFIQYGCFGLLAALVVWAVWRGIPAMLDRHEKVVTAIAAEHKTTTANMAKDHKEAVKALTTEFAEESRQCREERIELSKTVSADRELDRNARHELAEKLNLIVLNMRVKDLTQNPPPPRPTP